MDEKLNSDIGSSDKSTASIAKKLDAIKVDYQTVRVIVLTTAVVVVLLSIPVFWLLSHFITFDELDTRFKVSDSIRPRILDHIPEEIEAGYSKNFFVDDSHVDDPMIFSATRDQKVKLFIDVSTSPGLAVQPVQLQFNGSCRIDPLGDSTHTGGNGWDLTPTFQKCSPRDINTLRIVLPELKKGTKMQVQCLLLVSERLHDSMGKK